MPAMFDADMMSFCLAVPRFAITLTLYVLLPCSMLMPAILSPHCLRFLCLLSLFFHYVYFFLMSDIIAASGQYASHTYWHYQKVTASLEE